MTALQKLKKFSARTSIMSTFIIRRTKCSNSGGICGMSRPISGRDSVSGISGMRIGVFAEQHVAHGEPHRIVAADAGGIIAAFVEAMRTQQALVQMAGRGLGNIVDDDRLEIRRLRRRQSLAARFDHAGDRQRIPQRLSETLLEQQRLLRHVREMAFDHQLLRGVDHFVTAAFQSLRPGADRRPAVQRARRNVSARRVEAAVQRVARFEMRFRIRMIGEDFFRRIAELGHAFLLPVALRFLDRSARLIICQLWEECQSVRP